MGEKLRIFIGKKKCSLQPDKNITWAGNCAVTINTFINVFNKKQHQLRN